MRKRIVHAMKVDYHDHLSNKRTGVNDEFVRVSNSLICNLFAFTTEAKARKLRIYETSFYSSFQPVRIPEIAEVYLVLAIPFALPKLEIRLTMVFP